MTDNEHTLEKLRIHERLQNVEQNLKLLAQSIDHYRESSVDRIETIHDTMKSHFHEDKTSFSEHNQRLRTLERIMWGGFGAIVVIEFITKFLK